MDGFHSGYSRKQIAEHLRPETHRAKAICDDYPQGTGRPDGSRITVDIDGRPIADEAIVAGRRVGGGADKGLSGSETNRFADALGLSPHYATRSGPDLRGDVGCYVRGAYHRIFVDAIEEASIRAVTDRAECPVFVSGAIVGAGGTVAKAGKLALALPLRYPGHKRQGPIRR